MKGGYAFVEFESEVDASDAVSFMHNSNLLERRIIVRPAGEPKVRGERPQGDFQRAAPLSGAPRQAYGYRIEIEVSH